MAVSWGDHRVTVWNMKAGNIFPLSVYIYIYIYID